QLIPKPTLGGCWCGPSYFKGENGLDYVVTSQGTQVKTWRVTSPPSLAQAGKASIISGQDAGFFTTVSGAPPVSPVPNPPTSQSCATGSGIIWAVSRPDPKPLNNHNTAVNLYAWSSRPAKTGYFTLLFGPAQAGDWPFTGTNANIVPTVSNGKVYVA